MSKFKFNFHRKSASLSSAASPNKKPDTSSFETRTHISAKDYIANLKSGRLSTIMSRTGRKASVEGPKTPLSSLFAPRLTRFESTTNRRNRRYTVSLSQFDHPPNRDDVDSATDVGLGLFLEPDSPLENLHLSRPSPSTVLSNPEKPSAANSLSTCLDPRESSKPDVVNLSYGHDTALSPPTYRTRSQDRENQLNQKAPAKINKTTLHHIAEILQQAARRIQQEKVHSQAEIFSFLAPLVAFICFLGIAAFLLKYPAPGGHLRIGMIPSLAVVILGGIGSALILLRGCIWLIGVLAQSFCEVDLVAMFRKGELEDVDGTRMGSAQMLVGLFG